MNSWLQVTSGRGPEECCWVVYNVTNKILEEAAKAGIKSEIIDVIMGDKPNTFKSSLIKIEGDNLTDFTSQWNGTIQWIGKSMFRPNHKRKNWFVGVNCLIYDESDINLLSKDIKIETMRASGHGGQHVNKTESAIRATHIPTGLTAIAQEERSQFSNKKLCLARLSEKIKQFDTLKKVEKKQEIWSQHNMLVRGNPVCIFNEDNFKIFNK
ncbi:MAG: peptide chain release factor H [Nitrospirae bacterium]|nr:peptide chain release factor H [Nitrospirota bacterium]